MQRPGTRSAIARPLQRATLPVSLSSDCGLRWNCKRSMIGRRRPFGDDECQGPTLRERLSTGARRSRLWPWWPRYLRPIVRLRSGETGRFTIVPQGARSTGATSSSNGKPPTLWLLRASEVPAESILHMEDRIRETGGSENCRLGPRRRAVAAGREPSRPKFSPACEGVRFFSGAT
jgi:hypothetical protein